MVPMRTIGHRYQLTTPPRHNPARIQRIPGRQTLTGLHKCTNRHREHYPSGSQISAHAGMWKPTRARPTNRILHWTSFSHPVYRPPPYSSYLPSLARFQHACSPAQPKRCLRTGSPVTADAYLPHPGSTPTRSHSVPRARPHASVQLNPLPLLPFPLYHLCEHNLCGPNLSNPCKHNPNALPYFTVQTCPSTQATASLNTPRIILLPL